MKSEFAKAAPEIKTGETYIENLPVPRSGVQAGFLLGKAAKTPAGGDTGRTPGETTIVQKLGLVQKTCNADFCGAFCKNGNFALTPKRCEKIKKKKQT